MPSEPAIQLPVFQLDGVTVPGRVRPRLSIASLAIAEGVTAVIGPSGAGKTTLLDLLVGFERSFTGQCRFAPPGGAGLPLYWSPTDGGLWSHLTARQHLVAVLSADQLDAADWLARFDLDEHAEARPVELSMGQRSRLGVARAIASGARVLVLDEPFAHVDQVLVGNHWRTLLDAVEALGTTLVFSTHDPTRVLAHADSVLVLADGQVRYGGGVAPLYHQPATEALACVLGPCNWLSEPECCGWTDVELPRCTRPEQLRLRPATDGPLVVRRTDHQGAVSRSVLQQTSAGRERSFCHVTTPGLSVGARVVMQLLQFRSLGIVWLLGWLLGGCTADAEATEKLPLQAVRHRVLPPMGKRLLAPRGLAMLGADHLIVLDNGGRVLVLDQDGEVLRQWMMPDYEVGRPEGVCLLRDGRIAVADTHYSRVVFFDRLGTVSATLGSHGEGPGQFIYPIKVVQDPAGNLYVAEYGSNDRIQKFTERGEHVLSFGSFGTGPGQFQRPSGLVWHGQRIYVADAVNHRVQVFTDGGEFLGILGQRIEAPADIAAQADGGRLLGEVDERLTFKMPYDLSIGPSGDLYVCEYGAGRVTRFTRRGRLVGRCGESGTGRGQLRTPWGLTVAPDGRVFVADTGNKRVVEWR